MIKIHALFQLKGEKMSDSSHCLNWLYVFGLKTVLDSGFHSMDFGFQVLDSGFLGRGTWIPDPNRYWDSLSWFVDSKAQFSRLHKQIFPDSGFWNPDILTWCLKLWRPGHQKRQPEVDFFSLLCSNFWLWLGDGRVPLSKISNFRLLFLASGTPAFSLLKLAIIREYDYEI